MKSTDLLPLEEKAADSWPADEWSDLTVLVAVSGGPDSVALLRALAKLKGNARGAGRLIVAHFDHHLREDSAADAEFVAALAKELDLRFEQGDATAAQLAQPFADGVEAGVRDLRYAFLQAAAEKVGARYVALGHTADDQVETVLFNLLRGTGLSGLAGMPRARALGSAASLIRPFLNIRRSEVIDYLQELGQDFRTDPSNQSPDFTRNRIRNELLPQLREKFSTDVDQALNRLAQLAADAQGLIESLADDLLVRCSLSSPSDEVYLNLAPLAAANRHLVREMFVTLWRRMGWPLQDMGFPEWDALAALAISPDPVAANCRTFPGHVQVRRNGEMLLLSPRRR